MARSQPESSSPKYQAVHVLYLSQVPETLIGALTELEQEYTKAMNDPGFKVRLSFTKLAWKVLSYRPLSSA